MPGVNRDWEIWCSISGADPGDKDQMKTFNFDRRVARLAQYDAAPVHRSATDSWDVNPGCSMSEFLDLWLAAVQAVAGVIEEPAESAANIARPTGVVAEQVADDARRRGEAAGNRSLSDYIVANLEYRRQAFDVRQRERDAEERRRNEQRVVVRKRIAHLYNTTAVENLDTIGQLGILCHDDARSVPHIDVADPGVQDRRSARFVGSERLHAYASLYFNPRNAMLARMMHEGRNVVVLRISTRVLDLPGAEVTDGNAASAKSRIWPVNTGLERIDLDRIYSKGGRDADLIRVTQAEVLVPRRVPPEYLLSVIAPSRSVATLARRAWPSLRVDVDEALFFAR